MTPRSKVGVLGWLLFAFVLVVAAIRDWNHEPPAPAHAGGSAVVMCKIDGSNSASLVLWSRSQPVVTKTHEGWTVRFGK